ncbi:hypothetical protein BRD14_06410 [Halobacteriales archaeon SW_5_68_122]|nr:MAG: hypothetical protein BRD14_06410 [Halobacteriales archaeon SW_5_68_122]
MSEPDRSGTSPAWLRLLGLENVHPWVFLAHAVFAVGAFAVGTIGLLDGAGLEAVPMLGVGVLILLLGRSAGRLAARR